MIDYSSLSPNLLTQLSQPLQISLSNTPYTPPESTQLSIKSLLQSLFPNPTHQTLQTQTLNFSLLCAALASSQQNDDPTLSWIPNQLSLAAKTAFAELSIAIFGNSEGNESFQIGELSAELMPDLLPVLKMSIKESAIDPNDDGDEISAASARTPVAHAVVAACQFRWFVTKVSYPNLGKLCAVVVPCALTALDHWSPAVKRQGMISFIHLAKNVNAAEIGWYEDAILDICCKSIASDDDLWHNVVDMSVLFLTSIHRTNPRSSWFEKMMNEMLSHLERQPRNKERYTNWLELIEPVFNAMGLVLLAHFRRIFPLLFQWMHTDCDETVLLVLKRVHTIIRLTWIRNTPYIERLVDELTILYKEAALRRAREEIREHVLAILILLQNCKGLQFETAWNRYRDDPNLTGLAPSFSREKTTLAAR